MATATVTKDTIINDILEIDPETAPFFMALGMHCIGCMAASGETVEQACYVHGIDPDFIVEKLNAFIHRNDKDNDKD